MRYPADYSDVCGCMCDDCRCVDVETESGSGSGSESDHNPDNNRSSKDEDKGKWDKLVEHSHVLNGTSDSNSTDNSDEKRIIVMRNPIYIDQYLELSHCAPNDSGDGDVSDSCDVGDPSPNHKPQYSMYSKCFQIPIMFAPTLITIRLKQTQSSKILLSDPNANPNANAEPHGHRYSHGIYTMDTTNPTSPTTNPHTCIGYMSSMKRTWTNNTLIGIGCCYADLLLKYKTIRRLEAGARLELELELDSSGNTNRSINVVLVHLHTNVYVHMEYDIV